MIEGNNIMTSKEVPKAECLFTQEKLDNLPGDKNDKANCPQCGVRIIQNFPTHEEAGDEDRLCKHIVGGKSCLKNQLAKLKAELEKSGRFTNLILMSMNLKNNYAIC